MQILTDDVKAMPQGVSWWCGTAQRTDPRFAQNNGVELHLGRQPNGCILFETGDALHIPAAQSHSGSGVGAVRNREEKILPLIVA
jgi:hypothetical protein